MRGILQWASRTAQVSFVHETGGDPRTDLPVQSNACVGADSPHSGGLATQTAILSPACTVLGVSTALTHDSEVRDEFPSISQNQDHRDEFLSSAEVSENRDGLTTILQDPEQRDGYPSSAEVSECRDGFSRAGDMEYSGTVFSRDFYADENSERVRQSDSGVQIVPASVSPTELSTHQMGLSLAGTFRLKSEPIGIDPTGTLDIGETVQLTTSDRALLRKFKSSGKVKENSQQAGTYKQEISTSVSRVDGHPPKPSLSLHDRMLLRKYPDAGMKTMLSPSSTLVSSPPVVHPVESVKKRRRFFGKGNSNKANTGAVARNENSPDQESSPCGFPSKVAEPPVHPGPAISQSIPVSGLFDFTLLYYTLVLDNAIPFGYLEDFRSLEAPARRAVKRLQTYAASISDSMASTALSALRRESEHRASLEKSIGDQLAIAADIRPKRFRTKWQRAIYDGPTARKDAEAAERDRWIQLLANLLRSTDTPMGKMIRESPSNIQLLGGGRRAGTLRSRVRSVQKFLGWLIASHGISFPVHWRQLTEYLQVRYSEPCVRGSLKLVHSSYIFLQRWLGLKTSSRIRRCTRYH